jgi:hypothetical protein
MRKYSTVRASANELGGMMQTSPRKSTKFLASNAFGVDDRRIDVGEDLEFVRAADVVAVARGPVRNHLPPAHFLHLARLERLDQAVLGRHPADPAV